MELTGGWKSNVKQQCVKRPFPLPPTLLTVRTVIDHAFGRSISACKRRTDIADHDLNVR